MTPVPRHLGENRWLPLLALLAGCWQASVGDWESYGTDSEDPAVLTRSSNDDDPAGGEPSCDGFDDDGDLRVDEGCPCEPGLVQACYPGQPAELESASCSRGTQTCGPEGAWSWCEGAVVAGEEECDDGIDGDCDGEVDEDCGSCIAGDARPCYPGDPAEVGVGACRNGTQSCEPSGSWGECEGAVLPSAEVCGDGVDDDCDGEDLACAGPATIDVPFAGNCVTATCPDSHPFPIGCAITFLGDDDEGCVAWGGGRAAFFKESDDCDDGELTGTMTCSTEPGAGLTPDTCPIAKDDPDWVTDQDDCPD